MVTLNGLIHRLKSYNHTVSQNKQQEIKLVPLTNTQTTYFCLQTKPTFALHQKRNEEINVLFSTFTRNGGFQTYGTIRFDFPELPFYSCFKLLLHRYLENEHIRHCVPSNVSSGLATLPLNYVWTDQSENKSWPTVRTLPTGEALNGPKAYSLIMSYFTTNDMTPLEVHELGKKQLNILYPMVRKSFAGREGCYVTWVFFEGCRSVGQN